MFCTKCGAKIPESANFCGECGAKNNYKIQPDKAPVNKTVHQNYNISKKDILNSRMWIPVCGFIIFASIVGLITLNFLLSKTRSISEKTISESVSAQITDEKNYDRTNFDEVPYVNLDGLGWAGIKANKKGLKDCTIVSTGNGNLEGIISLTESQEIWRTTDKYNIYQYIYDRSSDTIVGDIRYYNYGLGPTISEEFRILEGLNVKPLVLYENLEEAILMWKYNGGYLLIKVDRRAYDWPSMKIKFYASIEDPSQIINFHKYKELRTVKEDGLVARSYS